MHDECKECLHGDKCPAANDENGECHEGWIFKSKLEPEKSEVLGSNSTPLLYRLLRNGEVICGGDEHLKDDCINWEPVNRWAVGERNGSAFQPIRRAV